MAGTKRADQYQRGGNANHHVEANPQHGTRCGPLPSELECTTQAHCHHGYRPERDTAGGAGRAEGDQVDDAAARGNDDHQHEEAGGHSEGTAPCGHDEPHDRERNRQRRVVSGKDLGDVHEVVEHFPAKGDGIRVEIDEPASRPKESPHPPGVVGL